MSTKPKTTDPGGLPSRAQLQAAAERIEQLTGLTVLASRDPAATSDLRFVGDAGDLLGLALYQYREDKRLASPECATANVGYDHVYVPGDRVAKLLSESDKWLDNERYPLFVIWHLAEGMFFCMPQYFDADWIVEPDKINIWTAMFCVPVQHLVHISEIGRELNFALGGKKT